MLYQADFLFATSLYYHLSFAGFVMLYSHFFACLHLHVSLIHTVNTYKHIIWLDITVTSLVSDSRNMTGRNESPSLDIFRSHHYHHWNCQHISLISCPRVLGRCWWEPTLHQVFGPNHPHSDPESWRDQRVFGQGIPPRCFLSKTPWVLMVLMFLKWEKMENKLTNYEIWMGYDGIKYWQCILYRCGIMKKTWYVEG